MNWIIGTSFIAVILYLLIKRLRKQKQSALKKEILTNWAKPKADSYFNFNLIELFFKNKSRETSVYHIIDDRTFLDLNLKAIFKIIDRTSSKIGQQYLYFKLRTVESRHKLDRFERLANTLQNNLELRISSQLELGKLNGYNSYNLQELFRGKTPERPKNLVLLYALSIMAILTICISIFYPVMILFLLPVFTINMIYHYRNKESVLYYLNGVAQLAIAFKVSKKLSAFHEFQDYYDDFSFLEGVNRLVRKTRLIGFEKQLSNEFAAVVWLFSELIKIMFNIEYILFHRFLKSIDDEKLNIENMFLFIGEIDAAIFCASVKSGEMKICKHQFTAKKTLSAKGLYQPIIENCIKNDFELCNSSLLLTGSNMSGKTTFIRTIGVNVILSQTLNFCFADAFTIPYLKVYSSIGVSDDLMNGRSYYLQEVLRIKELINATEGTEPCLIILDELFKGTNTVERISAGKAVLSYLNLKNSFVLVSTHDIELTQLLKEENYELYHFSELVKQNELFFDHKIKAGMLKTHNALQILALNNYPKEIVEAAKLTEKKFDQQHMRTLPN